MKGQSKRFADHKGRLFSMFRSRNNKRTEVEVGEQQNNIGFFELWRYAELIERVSTCAAVCLAFLCSIGLVGAIVIYGELTSLLVQRHKGEGGAHKIYILPLFGGGQQLGSNATKSDHMDALVWDSIAFGLASVAIMCVQILTASLSVTMSNWAGHRMVSRLRYRLLAAALRQEISFYDTHSTINFASIITDDLEKVCGGVSEHISMLAYLGGSVAAAGGAGAWYGWQLTLTGLSVIPLACIVAATVAKYTTRLSAAERAAYGEAGGDAQEALAGIRTVRAYAGEELELKRYVSKLSPAAEAARRRGLVAGVGSGIGWLLTYALNALVLSYGARLCVRDMELAPEEQQYNPGVMLTILFCTFMSAQNVSMCPPHLELVSAARGAAKSVYALLERDAILHDTADTAGDTDGDTGVKPAKFKGDIRFDNVYFNYPSRPDVKILRGLTLAVRSGETVALVGSSGCGKSTVLQLLLRLYRADSGDVTVDDVPLGKLHLKHFRTSIGVVGQEPVLFSGTIRENITLGMGDVTDDDVIIAAKTAHAHHFIVKLTDGYSTPVGGSGGAALSGGQKQRIAIARALLRRPAILLLDEPTSALDPDSERQVQAALDAASKGRTTLVVSHRLSTIVNCSRIVYIDQGAVLEQGTYKELLDLKGAFYQLVQADMSGKSGVGHTVSQSADDEDDVVTSELDHKQHFKRAFSRQSVVTSSIRGSIRSLSSARVPLAAAAIMHQHANDLPPSEEEELSPLPPPSSWELLKLNSPEWRLLVGGGVASFTLGATMPLFALLFSNIYGMFASSDPDQILSQSQLYAGVFAAVAAVCGGGTFLQAWLFHLAGGRLTDRLRGQLYRAYLYQEQAWHDRRENSVGALCGRLAADCAAVQGATGTRLGSMLQGVSTMVLGVTLAMCYSWKMTLVSLLSIPCVMGGIALEGWSGRVSEQSQRASLERAGDVATEAVINIRTVQSLGVADALLARYSLLLRESLAAGAATRRLRGVVYGVCLCAPTLGYAVSLAYGGYLVARDDMPYEYAILVSEALIYGAWMLAEALSFAPNFAAARRSAARILSALSREPRVGDAPGVTHDPAWTAKGEIEFKHVSFSYPSRPAAPVLRDVSLAVRGGERVALVGGSGSGKSTLLQLLLRNYDPTEGTVELDGRDISRSLSVRCTRASLGVVQQEPALFARTVAENIAYGDNTRTRDMADIIEAAKKANVHAFIASLPNGYETDLGAGGAQLSGGQKQRLAIARALLRDPPVLLLDEATSALDADSEKVVSATLDAVSAGRSTLVVAHRLATVRDAHRICVMHKGEIVERGTHSELVNMRGHYYNLLLQQEGHA